MFVLLNELENAATAPTTKTIERLLIWVDVKGGRFLLVKRAKRSKLDSASLERKVTSHDINNVQRGCDLLDGFRRNSRHGGDGSQFAVHCSRFTVLDRQAAR